MRFRGGGVGHKSTRDATNLFKTDRDSLDYDRHRASIDSDVENKSETTDATSGESEEADSNRDPEDCHGKSDDEEGDYGYVRDISEDDSDKNTDWDSDQELSDDMFGPEGANCASMDNMDELGYADL